MVFWTENMYTLAYQGMHILEEMKSDMQRSRWSHNELVEISRLLQTRHSSRKADGFRTSWCYKCAEISYYNRQKCRLLFLTYTEEFSRKGFNDLDWVTAPVLHKIDEVICIFEKLLVLKIDLFWWSYYYPIISSFIHRLNWSWNIKSCILYHKNDMGISIMWYSCY